MRQHYQLSIILALTLAASGTARANLVQNGNFAQTTYSTSNQFGTAWTQTNMQGVTSWTGNGGYNLFYFAGTATTSSANSQFDSGYNTGKEKLWGTSSFTGSSPSGDNFVAFDSDPNVGGGGGISQTITGLTAGVTYSLSFVWAGAQLQTKTGATTEQLQVTLGSDTQLTNVVSNPSQGFTGWATTVMSFVASSSTEALNFLAIGTPSGAPPTTLLTDVSLTVAPEPESLVLVGTGALGLLVLRRRPLVPGRNRDVTREAARRRL
jgi:hypothetical protein